MRWVGAEIYKKDLRPSEADGPLALQEALESSSTPFDGWTMIFYQQKRDCDASRWHVHSECVFPRNDNPKPSKTLAIGASKQACQRFPGCEKAFTRFPSTVHKLEKVRQARAWLSGPRQLRRARGHLGAHHPAGAPQHRRQALAAGAHEHHSLAFSSRRRRSPATSPRAASHEMVTRLGPRAGLRRRVQAQRWRRPGVGRVEQGQTPTVATLPNLRGMRASP